MKKILIGLLITLTCGIFLTVPTFAECPKGCVPTSILGNATGTEGEKCSCEKSDENGIMRILKLVVDIMTIGIGILGVVGISIVGVQYLTAGGNEEQTRKAKRRMLEIIIGLVAYAVIYALLTFLLPGFQGI